MYHLKKKRWSGLSTMKKKRKKRCHGKKKTTTQKPTTTTKKKRKEFNSGNKQHKKKKKKKEKNAVVVKENVFDQRASKSTFCNFVHHGRYVTWQKKKKPSRETCLTKELLGES